MLTNLLIVGAILAAAPLAITADELKADELKVEQYDGPTECEEDQKVRAGRQVSMHYTGKIDETSKTGQQGKVFDTSVKRGVFDFQYGIGQVIKGWDQGLEGLCVGAKATLVIPPEMGYGEQGAGADIPGGATLNFDVEVMGIDADAPPPRNLFVELDGDKDNHLTEEEIFVFFKEQGAKELPAGLMESEDQDKDGKISWEEFSGPKGTEAPVHEEL